MGITFTLDLEDHRADQSTPGRWGAPTHAVLDLLDERGAKGSFYIVGTLAERDPALIREIAERGHEIGFHSYDHAMLTEEDPSRFRTQSRASIDHVEDLTGKKVMGFRAPVYSLTRNSLWAVDALQELGLAYSTSVLPAPNPLAGFPGAPTRPFRWPNGLLEIPMPVAKLGGATLPYLGGVYFRYLPSPLIHWLVRRQEPGETLWTYCHPYDFDAEESFGRIRGAGFATSLICWLNRAGTLNKVANLPGLGAAPPLAERMARGDFDDVPVFDPATNALTPATPRSEVADAAE